MDKEVSKLFLRVVLVGIAIVLVGLVSMQILELASASYGLTLSTMFLLKVLLSVVWMILFLSLSRHKLARIGELISNRPE